ncbi:MULTISPECIES: hypothetical protein [unclassified Streptomyces]|uniref:hypothetical protein n=1 Tax=unclassified Streptomyces TaxID=2593676 RepID=UPI00131A1312|nr:MULTISPECIES: hypothetical protein [unclassified Streptomyces]MYX37816.1 hypothetical protein [Streptomyces sp. SID8377]
MGEEDPQLDEEVRRVLDAIDALGAADEPPAVRAKRLTQLLDAWPKAHSQARAMRQAALQEMQSDGMTLRAISAETGISFGRVREIIQGVTKRPKKKASDAPAAE